jgi:DNA polymerase elongation subunit (family B)
MRATGWILDASIDRHQHALTLWIKREGKTRGYTYHGFKPSVFVYTDLLTDSEWTEGRILRTIGEHPSVVHSQIVQRFVDVYDLEQKPVIQVFTLPDSIRAVAEDLERLPGATVFHADIDPVQQFFITREIFPFGRVEFEFTGETVTHIKCIDDREAVQYEVPDLQEVRIEVFMDTDRLFPTMEDPIHHIEIESNGKIVTIRERDERETLEQFQRVIDEIDPDIIVTKGGDENLFRYLTIRCKFNDFELVLSRDGTPLHVRYQEPTSFWQYNRIVYRSGNQVMFNGRIHIDRTESFSYSPSGMEGVIEGCRLAFAQPQRVARMSIGGVNAAVQFYNAHQMGILIPPVKRNPEFLKSVNELAAIDRGGLILQPQPDIYENIAECDFSSMYPTLMVTRNISPETICTRVHCPFDYEHCIEVPGLTFRLCNQKRGIVAKSLELILQKRKEFKRLIREGTDTTRYERMQNTLKGILVSCFGYLGFKNAKFGRVEAHTAVTALAREVLLATQEIGEEMGLEMVHGIVDSLWVRSDSPIEYELVKAFCEKVTEAVGIEMSLKGVYRWMVIPSSRLHPTIAPLNRYYGVYRNGGIKTRGIETRRRDTCLYVGDCQQEMIKVLAHGRNKEEFLERVPEAYETCRRYVHRLHEGDVDIRDLVLNSRLTHEPEEYQTTSRASIVAQQLIKAGRELHAGQKVRYIMIDVDSQNPLRRVKALELLTEDTNYDAMAYAKLCFRAFENLIPAQHLSRVHLSDHQPVKIVQ